MLPARRLAWPLDGAQGMFLKPPGPGTGLVLRQGNFAVFIAG